MTLKDKKQPKKEEKEETKDKPKESKKDEKVENKNDQSSSTPIANEEESLEEILGKKPKRTIVNPLENSENSEEPVENLESSLQNVFIGKKEENNAKNLYSTTSDSYSNNKENKYSDVKSIKVGSLNESITHNIRADLGRVGMIRNEIYSNEDSDERKYETVSLNEEITMQNDSGELRKYKPKGMV